MKLKLKLKLRSLLVAGCSVLIGVAIAVPCTWGWEQDNCADVLCPSGCYQNGVGGSQTNCNVQISFCCNCWFRSRKCYQNGTGSPCAGRSVPPNPNPYYWECIREEASGPCTAVGNGYECDSATDPFVPL